MLAVDDNSAVSRHCPGRLLAVKSERVRLPNTSLNF
jgi:hypothetical protein